MTRTKRRILRLRIGRVEIRWGQLLSSGCFRERFPKEKGDQRYRIRLDKSPKLKRPPAKGWGDIPDLLVDAGLVRVRVAENRVKPPQATGYHLISRTLMEPV
jgi:hypothetical protein